MQSLNEEFDQCPQSGGRQGVLLMKNRVKYRGELAIILIMV